MVIDDPLDAAEEQIAAEKRTESGLVRYGRDLSEMINALPTGLLPPGISDVAEVLKAPFKMFAWHLRKVEDGRRKYLVEVVVDELRWVRDQVSTLEEEHQRFIREEFPDLLLDALQKAERTRSHSRIQRMGKVLGASAQAGAAMPADEVEELLRLSTDLDDTDIRVLIALVEGQRDLLSPLTGMVTPGQANKYWQRAGRTNDETRISELASSVELSDGALQSACAKLQAYGLLVQIERDESKLPRGVILYAILPRAVAFVDALLRRQSTEET